MIPGAATAKTAPRRVCHLRATNFFGGPEKQILEHCRSLDRARWEPVLATFRDGDAPAELLTRAAESGLDHFEIAPRSGFDPSAVRTLARRLAELEIDVLVTHGYKPDLVGYLATRGGNARQIACMRGFTGENLRVRIYESIDRHLLRRIPQVICVSEATARLLAEHGVDAGRLRVVHNAVHFVEGIAPVDLRAELGLPAGVELIVAAGRLSPEKGHRILVDALALLRDRASLHVALLGEGTLRKELEARVAGHGLARRVHFLGFRRDVLGCLSGADLVVNPSFTEGLPNVVLEAFVAGTPVVATDVGGVAELIEHGRSGVLVPPGDPKALATAMDRAMNDPQARCSMAGRALDRVRERFTFESQASRLMDLYDRAVRPSGRLARRAPGEQAGARA